jgi:hypothetical protein
MKLSIGSEDEVLFGVLHAALWIALWVAVTAAVLVPLGGMVA